MRKNNNKGFTLVELLAIIVILAIIMVLAAPSMTKQIKQKEDTDQTILDKKIDNAAHLYAAKYYSDKIVNCTSGSCGISFTLNNLEQDGLINLKGKCAGEEDNKYIEVSYYGSSIKYKYLSIIDDADCISKDFACKQYCGDNCDEITECE